MGRWTEDFWGSDDALAVVRDVLIAAGLLPEGDCCNLQLLVVFLVDGGSLICRMSPHDIQRVVDAMDNRLSPAHLEALEEDYESITTSQWRMSMSMCGEGGALWAMLCMHVGAVVPPRAARDAEEAFGPDARGYWGCTPERKKLAAAYLRELRAYVPGFDGRVRFPAEMPLTLATTARTRHLRYQMTPNGQREPPTDAARAHMSSWSVIVHRSCSACGLMGTVRACGRCHATKYCNTECQRVHWPTHKAVCKAATAARGMSREQSCGC